MKAGGKDLDIQTTLRNLLLFFVARRNHAIAIGDPPKIPHKYTQNFSSLSE